MVFDFGETYGAGGTGGPAAQYGILVETPGVGKFFENNIIRTRMIYAHSAAGVQVGPNATRQSQLRGNRWDLGSIQPNGVAADAFNTFGSHDTGEFSITNQTGLVNRGFVFEPGSSGNFFTVPVTAGIASGLYNNSGSPNNIVVSNNVVSGALGFLKSTQSPVAGFAITIGVGVRTLLLTPAGVLATGTITLPAGAVDCQEVTITSSAEITALTVSPNAGQSVNAPPTTLVPRTTGPYGYSFIYDLAATTWFRTQ
jgi:hypothetical protein